MLLVWGRRWYQRKMGYVADFCEICRRPQSFRIDEDRLLGHFWYIPLGELHATRHQITCTECRTRQPVERIRYQEIARSNASAKELVPKTFPRLEHVEQDRIAIEFVVRDNPGTLTRQQREWLLKAPFVIVSRMVEQRFSTLQFDLFTALGVLSLFFIPALVARASVNLSAEMEQMTSRAALAVCLALIVVPAITARRRWVRRTVVPSLEQSLAPLKPTRLELDRILKELVKNRHRLGKKLSLEDFARITGKR